MNGTTIIIISLAILFLNLIVLAINAGISLKIYTEYTKNEMQNNRKIKRDTDRDGLKHDSN